MNCAYARKAIVSFVVFVGLCFLSLPAFTQSSLGNISGSITDQSGGAIAGAAVSVVDVARGVTHPLVTDSAGLYAAESLTPGMYTVRAEAKGFKIAEHTGIELGVGKDIRVDLVLQPGEQTQTITVTGDLPIVTTTNAQLGGTLENVAIEQLPLNGRDYQYMLGTRPGIVMHPNAGANDFASNGSRADDVNWMFDGLFDANIFGGGQSVISAYQLGPDETNILPLDSIQEVDMIENPKAEYGDRAGAHVNVGLKSGTNSIHGTAYAFGRDTDLNAKNPFLQQPAGAIQLPKAPLNLEQYGASMGGPIKKDKFFYFMNYEGQKYNVGNPRISVLPTTASLATSGSPNGNTSSSFPDALYDILQNHTTVTPSALSLNLAGCGALVKSVGGVTSGNFTPAQVTALKADSLATLAAGCSAANGLFLNSSGSSNLPTDLIGTGGSNNAILKFDVHPNDKHALNFEWYAGGGRDIAPASSIQPYWASDLYTWSDVWRGVWVWTPNSNYVNELRFGYEYGQLPVYLYECDPTYSSLPKPTYQSQFGFVPVPCSDRIIGGFPVTTISGFTALGASSIAQTGLQEYATFTDSLSRIIGKHQFKAGVEIRPQLFIGSTPVNGRGTLGFGGVNAFPAGSTATALEDFVAGVPSNNGLLLAGNTDRDVHIDSYGAFIQDDWRVTPRITLNLGVRWEYTGALRDTQNKLGNFDAASPTGLIQETSSSDVYKPDIWNFEPRIGLAWDVTGTGKTVIHANFSSMETPAPILKNLMYTGGAILNAAPTGFTYYNAAGAATPGQAGTLASPTSLTNGNIATGTLTLQSSQIPWAIGTPPFNSTVAGLSCGNGNFVTGSATLVNPPPCTLNSVALNFHQSYFMYRSLGLQHAVTNNLSIEVNYVGSHGSALNDLENMNAPTLGAKIGAGTAGAQIEQDRRPYFTQFPDFNNIFVYTNQDISNYDSIQFTVSQRVSHGLNFTAGYVLARTRGEGGAMDGIQPKDSYGPTGEQAYGGIMTFQVNYNIPGRKSPGQLLEGWQVNTSVNLTGGFPANPTDGTDDLSGTGVGADRWTLVGDPSSFDRLIGGAGTNALTNQGAVPCWGIAGSSFGKTANCANVTVPTGLPALSAATAAQYVQNMPAACVQAAAAEPVNTSGTVPAGTANSTGLWALASLGCYTAGSSVIVPPAQGTFGNMAYDALRGKAFHNWDFSATKTWTFKERYRAQFRAEFFNLLNRTGYTPPGVSLASPATFGDSTATPDSGNVLIGSGPRKIQLGLKIIF